MTQPTIKIFVGKEHVEEKKLAPALLGGDSQKKEQATEIPISTLKQNLDAFINSLEAMIPLGNVAQGDFHLKSFNVAVGVNGKGEVGFLGTGVEVGATATLTLAFERK